MSNSATEAEKKQELEKKLAEQNRRSSGNAYGKKG
ncbi:hypothetical protein M2168_006284 [Streptomyces sp. CZ24]|nr:hypothetical protein [Streptomyces sp. CZ24]